ncbi:MAG: NAD(P)-binding domain-containing protein [Rhodospirillales bacterium]|nr:NAD(P)-binding domain-containing protein [Rhodospirillales bacterium]MBO6788064.1 NAD(P)-binding domain-containing protein [Rhodospirillales bacterium]
MKIGIIGIGHLGFALAEGYALAGRSGDIIVSPRGREKTALLRATYGIDVASDNADVVRNADAVIVATRPADVIETVRLLPWRNGQVLISAAAGITAGALRGAAAPAEVARAMPVLASRYGASAIPLYPDHAGARDALAPLGRVTAIRDEDAFSAASALGGWFGWLFELTGETADILVESGVEKAAARKVCADMMRAAGTMMAETPEKDPRDTLVQLATPGGITEAGINALRDAEAFGPWRDAMSAATARLQALGRSGK